MTQLLEGENLWDTLLMLSLYIFIPFFVWADVMMTIFAMVIYAACFVALKNYILRMKGEKIQGVNFLDADVLRDKEYSQEMLLGYIKRTAIILDEKIDIRDKDFYREAQISVLEELKKEWDEIEEKYGEVTEDMDKKGKKKKEFPLHKYIDSEELKKGYIDEFGDTKEFAKLNVSEDDLKAIVDSYKIGELFAYNIKLFEPRSFSDTEFHEFDRMVLLTKREIDKELVFAQTFLNVDGYFLNGFAAKCSLICLAWVVKDIPILFVNYSEADAFDKMDVVIDKDKAKSIQIRTMQRIIYSLRSFFERFHLEIEELESLFKAERKKRSKLSQRLRDEIERYDDGEGETYKDGIYLETKWVILLGLGWIVGIIFISLFAGVFI